MPNFKENALSYKNNVMTELPPKEKNVQKALHLLVREIALVECFEFEEKTK